ncbi:MAG: tetratricopeptide repeat protein, partial [Gammaproteobacteria bacterium]|nr:tetratricopeptide repeat protein [Gammaproteobacteria bacterium]
ALEQAQELVQQYPSAFIIWNIMGAAAAQTGRLEEAVDAFKKVTVLNPGYANGHNNLGIALKEQNKLEEAITAYQKALTHKPDYAEAYLNMSLAELLLGNFDKGFELYEWRTKREKEATRAIRSEFAWDKTRPLDGARFLIYEEQGLGDTIQFCRYLPVLAEQGVEVSFKVTPKLHKLLRTLSPKTTLCTEAPADDAIDYEAPLLSLPYLLGTQVDTIPAPIPYLYAEENAVNTWR